MSPQDYTPSLTVTMTNIELRDWFAGMALQGFVSSYKNGETCDFQFIAGDSYSLAGAMLAAREGKEEE